MANSRRAILQALREQQLPEAPLPSLEGGWITFEDPVARFEEMVTAVGGQCLRVSDHAALRSALGGHAPYADAKKRFCAVPEVGESNVDPDAIEDPHALEDVDFALFAGRFGVAENGAVWVTDEELRHRVLFFIAQHVALVVSAREIVSNMHQAYARLSLGERRFGTFISGPSKTADIEQSLVIGAHGARSLMVCLIGEN